MKRPSYAQILDALPHLLKPEADTIRAVIDETFGPPWPPAPKKDLRLECIDSGLRRVQRTELALKRLRHQIRQGRKAK